MKLSEFSTAVVAACSDHPKGKFVWEHAEHARRIVPLVISACPKDGNLKAWGTVDEIKKKLRRLVRSKYKRAYGGNSTPVTVLIVMGAVTDVFLVWWWKNPPKASEVVKGLK